MQYLLDTNIISALRVPHKNPEAARWCAKIPFESLYISVVTIAEIERGIYRAARTDAPQAEKLRTWFESSVLHVFAHRVLPFDLTAARVLASYRVPEHAPFDDALIAATAEANGLIVVTHNTKHFEPLQVPYVNPVTA